MHMGMHPKRDRFIIKMDTINMGLNFNQLDMSFNP